jgi:hypothetical protein
MRQRSGIPKKGCLSTAAFSYNNNFAADGHHVAVSRLLRFEVGTSSNMGVTVVCYIERGSPIGQPNIMRIN